MTNSKPQPAMTSASPFFIISSIAQSLSFYGESLGFDVVFRTPDPDPFFAIVRRDGAQLFLKVVADDVEPVPNWRRHPWARWDAFVHAPDPDALAAELSTRGVGLSTPLADTDDGLRGFEVKDPDGYVLFFGRPR